MTTLADARVITDSVNHNNPDNFVYLGTLFMNEYYWHKLSKQFVYYYIDQESYDPYFGTQVEFASYDSESARDNYEYDEGWCVATPSQVLSGFTVAFNNMYQDLPESPNVIEVSISDMFQYYVPDFVMPAKPAQWVLVETLAFKRESTGAISGPGSKRSQSLGFKLYCRLDKSEVILMSGNKYTSFKTIVDAKKWMLSQITM